MTEISDAPESDEERKRPLWRQIRDTLRGEIFGGAYPQGQLPPDDTIASRFGVSRMTARRSLASLETDGLIRIEQGRGTFINADLVSYEIGSRQRFSQNLLRSGYVTERRLIEEAIIPADEQTAAALNVEAGAEMIFLKVLGIANGVPLSLGLNYFPLPRFSGLGQALRNSGSLTGALSALGVDDYRRKSTKIITRLPDDSEARLLGQPRSRPVFFTESVDVDMQDKPIAFGRTCFAGDRVQLVLDS